jgi:hypothetical protein
MRKQMMKKLSLHTETLRTLSSSQLGPVVGNIGTNTVCGSCHSACPDSGCQNSICIC